MTSTTNGQLHAFTTNQYQIYAGIQQPILEDTKEITWIPHSWISSIRQFLHTTNSKICLQNPWTPKDWRVHNHCIMDNAMQCRPSSLLKTVNSVRMYLCVSLLSEISDSSGTSVLHHMLDDNASPFPSQLMWPYQPTPT